MKIYTTNLKMLIFIKEHNILGKKNNLLQEFHQFFIRMSKVQNNMEILIHWFYFSFDILQAIGIVIILIS